MLLIEGLIEASGYKKKKKGTYGVLSEKKYKLNFRLLIVS